MCVPSWSLSSVPIDGISRTAGRSVNACRFAFEELKRPSGYSPQTPLSAPLSGVLKRPWQPEQPPPAGPREIRPKTDLAAGTQMMPQASRPQESSTKKKRGRPTKADVEAKRLAAAATGGATSETSFGPRLPLPPHLPTMAPAMVESLPIGPRASLPPPPSMPISTMITPTAQKTTSNSSSSSGKRRRGKSLRLDHTEPIPAMGVVASASQHQQPSYQSPYGNVQTEETPARMAAMRHPDETSTGSAPASAESGQFPETTREPAQGRESAREASVGYYQPHRPASRPPT